MKIILLLLLSCLTLSLPAQNRGLRDTLKGLVFEAEDWSEPKDAWLPDQSTPNKWNLWSKEEDVWNKRSNGKSLQSPFIKEDRATPEEGAPPLHTKITGIPNGLYEAFLGNTSRPLGYSLDGGKNWLKSTLGETSLGFYDIQDGTFEVWVDDKFANTGGNLGWAYYDYVRLLQQPSRTSKTCRLYTSLGTNANLMDNDCDNVKSHCPFRTRRQTRQRDPGRGIRTQKPSRNPAESDPRAKIYRFNLLHIQQGTPACLKQRLLCRRSQADSAENQGGNH